MLRIRCATPSSSVITPSTAAVLWYPEAAHSLSMRCCARCTSSSGSATRPSMRGTFQCVNKCRVSRLMSRRSCRTKRVRLTPLPSESTELMSSPRLSWQQCLLDQSHRDQAEQYPEAQPEHLFRHARQQPAAR